MYVYVTLLDSSILIILSRDLWELSSECCEGFSFDITQDHKNSTEIKSNLNFDQFCHRKIFHNSNRTVELIYLHSL